MLDWETEREHGEGVVVGGGESKDSTNNLYNYHHLLLLLPGRETLHPFVAMAPGGVPSKLITTIKIRGRKEAGGKLEGTRSEGCCGGGGEKKKKRKNLKKGRFLYLNFV